mmetsp:Transcript_15930/g.49871  ORF Transcript_15930/g.49871 Transcript_15930/m.49871 type:complete len:356 (+) Transcript_15930:175-1242(+)
MPLRPGSQMSTSGLGTCSLPAAPTTVGKAADPLPVTSSSSASKSSPESSSSAAGRDWKPRPIARSSVGLPRSTRRVSTLPSMPCTLELRRKAAKAGSERSRATSCWHCRAKRGRERMPCPENASHSTSPGITSASSETALQMESISSKFGRREASGTTSSRIPQISSSRQGRPASSECDAILLLRQPAERSAGSPACTLQVTPRTSWQRSTTAVARRCSAACGASAMVTSVTSTAWPPAGCGTARKLAPRSQPRPVRSSKAPASGSARAAASVASRARCEASGCRWQRAMAIGTGDPAGCRPKCRPPRRKKRNSVRLWKAKAPGEGTGGPRTASSRPYCARRRARSRCFSRTCAS